MGNGFVNPICPDLRIPISTRTLKMKGFATPSAFWFVLVIIFALTFRIPENNPRLATEYERGEYEKASLDAIRPYLTSGATVLDIGAWAGWYAIHASKPVGPQGKVIAFEPDPRNFEFLVGNVRMNGCGNVVCLPLAIGDRSEPATFWRDAANTGATSGKHEAVPIPGSSFTALVARLDDLFPCASVNVIKSDIQGAELRMLRGAEKLIERCRPVIFFEWWPEGIRAFGDDPKAILQFLSNCGYDVRTVGRGLAPDPKMKYCNAIARPR